MRGTYVVVSGVIFGLVAVVHAIRAFNQWPVQVATFEVPLWTSWVGFLVAGSLCAWALLSARKVWRT